MRCRASAVAVLSMLLVACGESGPATSSTGSPSPTSLGKRFLSAKFSTIVPNGWTDQTADQTAVAAIHAGGQVLMLFYTSSPTLNEHIDVSVAPQPVPPDQLGGYLQSVAHNGATNLTQPQSFNLDGETGIFITYDLMSSGGTVLEDQDMVVNHGGDTYDIVLNTALVDFNTQLQALQSILSAWKWS